MALLGGVQKVEHACLSPQIAVGRDARLDSSRVLLTSLPLHPNAHSLCREARVGDTRTCCVDEDVFLTVYVLVAECDGLVGVSVA